MEISLLIVLDLREQAALQAALMTHGAPDCLVTLALTGACRIQTLDEARQLRRWLAETRASGKTDFASLNVIERELVRFVVSDATRATGSAQVAHLLVRRLVGLGVAPINLRIIFATGIHRKVTREEKA